MSDRLIDPLRGVAHADEWDGLTEMRFRGNGRGAECAHYRALYVGTSGVVVLVLRGGSTVTLRSLAAGVWHPVEFVAVVPYDGQDVTPASGVVAGW